MANAQSPNLAWILRQMAYGEMREVRSYICKMVRAYFQNSNYGNLGKVRMTQRCLEGVGCAWKAMQTGKDLYLNKMFSHPDCVKWEDAVRQKTEEGWRRCATGLWSLKTADVTALCAFGSNPGWQTRGRGAKKTLWSNYMDGWCTEAGINDTVMREAGAGLAPGLSVTAIDNALWGS